MRGPQENPNFYRSAARLGLATLAIPGAMLVDRLAQASPDLQAPSTVSTGITVRLPNRGPSQTESSLAPYGLEVRRNSGTIFAQTSTEVGASASVDPQFEGGDNTADNDETVFRSRNLMVAEAAGIETLHYIDNAGRQHAVFADNFIFVNGRVLGHLMDRIDGADPIEIPLKESFYTPGIDVVVQGVDYDAATGDLYVGVAEDAGINEWQLAGAEKIPNAANDPNNMSARVRISGTGLEGVKVEDSITSFDHKVGPNGDELEMDVPALDPDKRGVWNRVISAVSWIKKVISTATPTPTVVPPTATPTPTAVSNPDCGNPNGNAIAADPNDIDMTNREANAEKKGLPSTMSADQLRRANVAMDGVSAIIIDKADVKAMKNANKKKKVKKGEPPAPPVIFNCAPVQYAPRVGPARPREAWDLAPTRPASEATATRTVTPTPRATATPTRRTS